VAVGNQGQISTSTNPTGGDSAWTTAIIDTPSCGIAACTLEQIYAHDSRGTNLIDHTDTGGNGTSLANLQLSGNQLSWTHDGIPESANLG
jgi:hypothetical protein